MYEVPKVNPLIQHFNTKVIALRRGKKATKIASDIAHHIS
jgi:hypothetical protein